MEPLEGWRLLVVIGVGVMSIAWMVIALVALMSRRAAVPASVRIASDVESGLVGGVVPEGSHVFDAWSYRVGARFAGRVRIAIHPDRVAVAGPRIPWALYQLWLWVQALVLALVPPALVAAILLPSWWWLLAAVVLFVASYAISMGGAGLWPGLGELFVDGDGRFTAIEFPRAAVSEVDVGPGWSKGGLGVVLYPYKAGVDRMAAGHAVSFFAPDERGREVRFALHVSIEDNVHELAGLLREGAAGPTGRTTHGL